MKTYRKTAIFAGVLYIIGTLTGVLSVIFYGSVLDTPDVLSRIASAENRVILGALFVLAMGFSLAMVPVVMVPIFKKFNQTLAIGYVVFRGGLETTAYIALVITRLLLIVVSREYVSAGAVNAPIFQSLGAILLKSHDLLNPILIFAFSLGALMIYTLFYQSRLIPRWISVWGFIAIGLHFITGFLTIFGITAAMSPLVLVMNLPIFLQEMVMAVWLIAKGFEPAAIASLPSETK